VWEAPLATEQRDLQLYLKIIANSTGNPTGKGDINGTFQKKYNGLQLVINRGKS